MSNAKRTTIVLSDEAREFLKESPRGFRGPFVNALILEAQERFTSPEAITQFIMRYPNLLFFNLSKGNGGGIKVKAKEETDE